METSNYGKLNVESRVTGTPHCKFQLLHAMSGRAACVKLTNIRAQHGAKEWCVWGDHRGMHGTGVHPGDVLSLHFGAYLSRQDWTQIREVAEVLMVVVLGECTTFALAQVLAINMHCAL